MYYGLDAFRKYIQTYPAPYDDVDVDIIDCLIEGSVGIDEEGKLSPTAFMECAGEA